jgi:acyl-coenzyme A thioesterase PaaI-like protein
LFTTVRLYPKLWLPASPFGQPTECFARQPSNRRTGLLLNVCPKHFIATPGDALMMLAGRDSRAKRAGKIQMNARFFSPCYGEVF